MVHNDNFAALGLSDTMLAAVGAKGFEQPTTIQKLTIPHLLTKQNDIIAQSQTGTGKTAAYGLPVMQLLNPSKEGVQAIVLVPTRELALQVTEELLSYNKDKKLSIAAIYGGASMSEQLRRLSRGIDIVVGTPGRTLDHIRRGTLKLPEVQFLILDEADEMLNMGFIEDVEEIMSHTPEQRRVLLFSATMPQRIIKMSQTYMRDTEILKVESQQLTTELTDQIYFEVRESDKFDALTRIIDITPEFYGIVFGRTKIGVDEIVNRLLERGYAAEGLHGDVSQAQREKILRKFKNKQTNILVATDVAARGIDVNNLSHVINYSLPQDSESYVHRIGRTGRAGNQGTAITFLSPSEFRRFTFLKKDINADIQKRTLPSPQDIVAMKRTRIKEDLQEIVADGNYAEYGEMADELLAMYPPEIAMSALLRLAFRSELDESNYPEIRSFSVDRKGTARLFISIGRVDGYDVRKLIALVKRECGLKDNKINDVKLMDTYSFITVPFAEAEHVVRKLNKIRNGSRPLAEIAKPEAGGAGGAERKPRKKRETEHFDGGDPPEVRAQEREAKRAEAARKQKPRADDTKSPAREYSRDTRKPKAGKFSDEKPSTGRYSADKPAVSRRSDGKPAAAKSSAAGRKKPAGATPADGGNDNFWPKGYDPTAGNAGFDWSMFESGGNTWDERPSKKKRK